MRRLVTALVGLLLVAQPAEAQRRETARLGISVGGVSTVGLIVEYLDGQGEIGFISSISQPFCGGCTRARVTADVPCRA